MKLRADSLTIEAYGTIVTYAYKLEFPNILLQTWLRSSLQCVIMKLQRAKDRLRKALRFKLLTATKTAIPRRAVAPLLAPYLPKPKKKFVPPSLTITLNDSEALALFYSCEFWLNDRPNTLEATIAKKEIISPIQELKQ